MYEHFKHQFITNLPENIPEEYNKIVCEVLDKVAYNFDILNRETHVVLYNGDIPELLKTYLVCKKIEGLSKSTIYNYTIFLTKFFMFTNKDPNFITQNDIRVFLYDYQKSHNVSNRTLDKIRCYISSFLLGL